MRRAQYEANKDITPHKIITSSISGITPDEANKVTNITLLRDVKMHFC